MKEEIRKELEALGSALAREKEKRSYTVPEGYFDQMQKEVLQKLSSGKNETHRSSYRRLRPWIYSAAASVVLILAALFVLDRPGPEALDFEQLATEAIYAYLDENLDDISLKMLVTEEAVATPITAGEEDHQWIEEYLEENLDDLPIEVLEELL
jgi:hypothetical protein